MLPSIGQHLIVRRQTQHEPGEEAQRADQTEKARHDDVHVRIGDKRTRCHRERKGPGRTTWWSAAIPCSTHALNSNIDPADERCRRIWTTLQPIGLPRSPDLLLMLVPYYPGLGPFSVCLT